MKNFVLICCHLLCISTVRGQILNPEFSTLTNSCPPTHWNLLGITGCNLIDIAPGWIYPGTGSPFVLPPSQIAPNANPGDRVWVLFENTLGQFGGFSQSIGPLVIGETYCLKFDATVNRIFNPPASLAVKLEIDNVTEDSHTFVYGAPMQPVTLCFTATATNHQLSLRTDLISGLTTFLFIQEGSGSFDTPNCQNSLVVTGNPVLSGTYVANNNISCSDILDSRSEFEFVAGVEINLEPGFYVPVSSVFVASIEACL